MLSRWMYFERLIMKWHNIDGMNELFISSKYILPLQGEERIYVGMWMLQFPSVTLNYDALIVGWSKFIFYSTLNKNFEPHGHE